MKQCLINSRVLSGDGLLQRKLKANMINFFSISLQHNYLHRNHILEAKENSSIISSV